MKSRSDTRRRRELSLDGDHPNARMHSVPTATA